MIYNQYAGDYDQQKKAPLLESGALLVLVANLVRGNVANVPVNLPVANWL